MSNSARAGRKPTWQNRKQAYKIGRLFKDGAHRNVERADKELDRILASNVEKRTTFYPQETMAHAEKLCEFLFTENNLELARKVVKQDDAKPLVLAVNAWKFSFANTTSDLKTFLLGAARRTSRITTKACRVLGCKKVGTDKLFSVYDPFDVPIIEGYAYEDVQEDKEVYMQFVLDRMEALCATRGGEELYTDPGMDKYKRPIRPDLTAGQGMATLTVMRQYRDQPTASTKMLKKSMSVTTTMPCTTDKYKCRPKALIMDPNGLVVFYGTGPVDKKSRFAFSNVYSVDPLYDGPKEMGFRGTHKQFHKALLAGKIDIVPVHVVSDATGYVDTEVVLSFRGGNKADLTKLRQMDIDTTNKISNEIYLFWQENGYEGEFELVMGVTDALPKPIDGLAADLSLKSRPTNGEIDVFIGHTSESVVRKIIQEAGGNIYISNLQRLVHEKSGTFPERKYHYPDDFDTLVDNVRNNCVLIPPPPSGAFCMMEAKERKDFFKRFDEEDVSTTAVPNEIIDWKSETASTMDGEDREFDDVYDSDED